MASPDDKSADAAVIEADPTYSGSTVYGPVKSWRMGWSLGVDPIQTISTCSFNCIYCQLGDIQRVTPERQVFVPTEKVLSDLAAADWSKVDVVTFSGSGEPSLALNLGDVIRETKRRHGKPTCVLTNAFHFDDPAARRDVAEADIVCAKLDAATDETLAKVNRPARPLRVADIVEGIIRFRSEFGGRLCVQTMLMPINAAEAEAMAEWLHQIQPDEIQLNTPRRFYPLVWRQENRGRHTDAPPEYAHRSLRVIGPQRMKEIIRTMREKTGVSTVCVYPV